MSFLTGDESGTCKAPEDAVCEPLISGAFGCVFPGNSNIVNGCLAENVNNGKYVVVDGKVAVYTNNYPELTPEAKAAGTVQTEGYVALPLPPSVVACTDNTGCTRQDEACNIVDKKCILATVQRGNACNTSTKLCSRMSVAQEKIVCSLVDNTSEGTCLAQNGGNCNNSDECLPGNFCGNNAVCGLPAGPTESCVVSADLCDDVTTPGLVCNADGKCEVPVTVTPAPVYTPAPEVTTPTPTVPSAGTFVGHSVAMTVSCLSLAILAMW